MKLIYVIIDGMGDIPVEEFGNETPLSTAPTPNMDNLARNGETGLMYTVGKGIAPESDVGVISILGYDPFKYATGRGILEAVGAGIKTASGNLALRCNFATMGRGNTLIDRRAGRNLEIDEAERLSGAIRKGVTLESHPVDFEFKSTTGHRAVLVIKSKKGKLSSKITNTDPAYTRLEEMGVAEKNVEMVLKKCEPLNEREETKISADLVNEFTEKSHKVLDKHEVNKKRVEEGKLKANVILARDAGHLLPMFFNLNKRYNLRFVCLADMPVERGIADLAGMYLVDLPPPSKDLKRDCLLRIEKLFEVLPRYDCFYIHIKGPDEPGHDGDFQLKMDLIGTIDKVFFGTLLSKINLSEFLICVTSDHATPCKLKAHSDDPVPVLIAGSKIKGNGTTKFSEEECRKGSLGTLQNGSELMPKLISYLKSDENLRKT